MKLNDIKSDFAFDSDTETEVIHLHYDDIANGMFYFKYRYLKCDFNGKEIKDSDDYIRTKSIWYIDFLTKTKVEIVPFGEFDVNEARKMGNYLYYTKITDMDNDGLLTEDYSRGEIFRINLKSFRTEYCCDLEHYNFHGFEMATERYIVFRSEDQIPDTAEIIFIDLKEKKKAVFTSIWDTEELDYKFILDKEQNPIYVVSKRFVSEGANGSEEDKLMCYGWDNFLNQLEWNELKYHVD